MKKTRTKSVPWPRWPTSYTTSSISHPNPVEPKSRGTTTLWSHNPVDVEPQPCGVTTLWSQNPVDVEPQPCGTTTLWSHNPVNVEPQPWGTTTRWSHNPVEPQPSEATSLWSHNLEEPQPFGTIILWNHKPHPLSLHPLKPTPSQTTVQTLQSVEKWKQTSKTAAVASRSKTRNVWLFLYKTIFKHF